MAYLYTRIWKINNKFVVSSDIQKAIELFYEVYPDAQIDEIKSVYTDSISRDCDAIISNHA